MRWGAVVEFLRRLADGDPVAVGILFGMLALAGAAGLIVLGVRRSLRRSDEDWARRRGRLPPKR